MSADPDDVATAARRWAATAAALHEAADRLAAQAPEVEERLRGRTGVVTAAALWRAVRALRADAEDAADGGAALADVAAALEEARLDPTDRARRHLAAADAGGDPGDAADPRPDHSPAPAPRGRRVRRRRRQRRRSASRPPRAGRCGRATSPPRSARGSSPPAPPAPSDRDGTEGTAAPARAPGATIPAGHGRSGRDRGSRDRRGHAAGIEEHWTDDDGAGPAVLGAG